MSRRGGRGDSYGRGSSYFCMWEKAHVRGGERKLPFVQGSIGKEGCNWASYGPGKKRPEGK